MTITSERAKSVRFALTLVFVLQGVMSTIMIPRIPELIDQIQVNFTAWGAIIGFSGLGALVGLMLANRLIVRFGSRRVLRAFAVGFTLALVPLPYIYNPWVFFILQALAAFAGASLNVALNAQAVVLQKHLNRTIIPKFHGSWSIGAATSAALSAYMASLMPMWLHFLIVPTIVALVMAWATSRALDVEEIGRVNQRKSAKQVPFWKSPAQLWLISIGWFAGVFPEAAIMDWSTVFGKKILNLDPALSAVPYTFFVVAMIISRLSIARITRKFHVGIASFWGGLFGATAMGLAVIFGPLIGAQDKIAGMFVTAILWFIAGLGIGPMSPTLTAASGQIKGLSTAQGLARSSLVMSVMIMITKVFMGAIAQNVNLSVAFILPTVLFFAASIISGIWARGENRAKTVIEDAFPITGSIPIISPGK
jgi:predicted MFS family arabinose efflux permease